MARLTREETKARTHAALIEHAARLFREKGYAATSLEEVAAAAEVTKGAIYAHFSSKEDLLLSAVEAAPSPDYSMLNDSSRTIEDRLADFAEAAVTDEQATDALGTAAWLEFLAALLRNDDARRRYGEDLCRRLKGYAADDRDEPVGNTTRLEAWAIGTALTAGLELFRFVIPEVITDTVFARAVGLLAALYEPGVAAPSSAAPSSAAPSSAAPSSAATSPAAPSSAAKGSAPASARPGPRRQPRRQPPTGQSPQRAARSPARSSR